MNMLVVMILFLFAQVHTVVSASKKMKRGTRYCYALKDNPKAEGYKWGDPVLEPAGIVRFDGPRKVTPVPNQRRGLNTNQFCFYALKPGNAKIMFKEYKATVPGRTTYLNLTVN